MRSRSMTIALWVVTGLLTLTFVITGISKLVPIPPSAENFARWGFSPTFRIFIGVAEVVGGLALLVPRLSMLAAVGLAVTMLGAIRTGIQFHETMHIVLPSVLIALLVFLVVQRRYDFVPKRD